MRYISILIVICIIALLPLLVLAQGGAPSLPSPPSQAPLGGIEILAALGGGYAIKKLWNKKDE